MIEKRISDWIDSHRDEFLRDVARMVAIESVGGESAPDAPFGPGPRAALDEMLKLCGEYGFATDIYHGAMGSADYNGKAARLDILGHLDVVGPGDGWDTDPYKATLKDDGCLYGRGTDDDKGPVVEALYAMRCLKELGVELEHGCRLLFGTDEETGSGDLHYYYDEHEPAPNTFTPDTGFPVYNVEKGMYRPVITRSWPGEAGQPRLVSAQGGFRINVVPAEAKAVIEGLDAPGALKFAGPCADKCGVELIASDTPAGCEILVRGKQTHAAYPQSGINAVTALLAVISELPLAGAAFEAVKELSRLFPHGDWLGEGCGIAQSDEISGELTISADIFELDETGLKLECDSRVPICAGEANCREALERRGREAGFEVTGGMIAAHHTPGDGEFVQSLLKCYEHYTGLKGECVSTGGGTYVHDIPGGVAFGASMPETENHMHGPDEFAVISELLTSAKIFAQVIVKLCG